MIGDADRACYFEQRARLGQVAYRAIHGREPLIERDCPALQCAQSLMPSPFVHVVPPGVSEASASLRRGGCRAVNALALLVALAA
jgi:hypothetical protein